MPLVASFCPAKTPVSPRSKSSPITLRIHDKQKQFRLHDSFALKYQNGRNEEDKLELEEEESDADSWYMRLLSKYKRSNNSEIDDTDSETEAIRTVHNLDEVRHALLVDKTNTLKDLDFAPDFAALRTNDTTQIVNATTATKEQLSHHPVLQLLAQRVATNSTPGNRAKGDTAHLALAIEGGGMRGSVSAGMAAAIATLGLTDAFDSVYGSSAGSIVGSYMISRQMCIDVYTQVLPAAKEKFACRRRVVRNLGVGLVNDLVQRLGQASPSSYFSWNENATSADNKTSTSDIETTRQTSEEMASITSRLAALMARFTPTILSNSMPALVSSLQPYLTLSPGMNISFVLEGVMSEQHGLRPFDMESFRRNDAKQPLYAVASTVRDGKLETVAFSSKEGDYFDIEVQNETMPTDNTIFVPEGKIRRAFRLVKRGVVKVGKLPLVVYRTVKKIFGRENSTDSTSNGKRNSTTKKARFVTADKSPLFRRFAKEKPTLNVVQKMENGTLIRQASACPDESGKKGFFACIESSMLVPGAAGPPVRLLRSKYRKDAQSLGIDRMASVCFDAFCCKYIEGL